MPAARITKTSAESDPVHPGETLPIAWDFAAEMGVSEQITSQAITAFDAGAHNRNINEVLDELDRGTDSYADVTITVLSNPIITAGVQTNSRLQVDLAAMTSGVRYLVKFIATVSAGKILESHMFIPCQEY